MNLRHLLSWKALFYEAFLPWASRLGPRRADEALSALGRLAAAPRPARRRAWLDSVARADAAIGAGWDRAGTVRALEANLPRFLARDYPLANLPDAEALARFEVRGLGALDEPLARRRGVILVGSHLGAHVAGLHWMYRREVPCRLLVQRPRHVSGYMHARFDRADGPHPQPAFFVRRDLDPSEAARRMLRALAALRDGMALYLTGDIPWSGPNARPGRLLGVESTFLSVWADLAALSGAPALSVFCTHRPGGRFALEFEPLGGLAAGDEEAAVARFLGRLDAQIAARPAEAVAHLTWPCYAPAELPAPASAPAPRGAPRALPARPVPAAAPR